MRIYASV